jgi:hypothetical protein
MGAGRGTDWGPATQLICPSITLVIISRRVIALTSQATCHACCSIARLYPARRTSLTAYDPGHLSVLITCAIFGFRIAPQLC